MKINTRKAGVYGCKRMYRVVLVCDMCVPVRYDVLEPAPEDRSEDSYVHITHV